MCPGGSFRPVSKLPNFKKFGGVSSNEKMDISGLVEGRDLIGDLLKVWESPRHLRCWDLSFVLRDIATLDEGGQVRPHSADRLYDDICHASSVLGFLRTAARSKKVLFFRSASSQFVCKLNTDQRRVALFINNGVHSMDCMRLLLAGHVNQ